MTARKTTLPEKVQTMTSAIKSSKPKILSSKTVFRGRIFDVTRDRVMEPNGITAIREVIRHSGSIVILAIDHSQPTTRVLLERQYRYSAEDYLLELPAGRIDPGEKVLAAAKRELLEETGYTARKWQRILHFYPSPGFLNETMTVLLAQSLSAGIANPEADEVIDHELVGLDKALKLIRNGLIRDGKTIAAILWFAQFG